MIIRGLWHQRKFNRESRKTIVAVFTSLNWNIDVDHVYTGNYIVLTQVIGFLKISKTKYIIVI